MAFNIFGKSQNKKRVGEKLTLKIRGMHCTSCAMNIDGELEELSGVISATTNYARATSTIEFDPQLIQAEEFVKVIKKLGYTVEVMR